MRRSEFIKLAAGACVALAAGAWGFLRRVPPVRCVRAALMRRYPGKVGTLDAADVSRPAHWSG